MHHLWIIDPAALLSSLRSVTPFYDPKTFAIEAVATGTSLAALSYGGSDERAAELINFGAFLAFIGVNAAALRHTLRNHRPLGVSGFLYKLLPPIGGLLFCLTIWVSLPRPAFISGSIWLAFGIIYQAISTRSFRKSPSLADLSFES
jgi:putrescine importer